jgi:hypothetical protein
MSGENTTINSTPNKVPNQRLSSNDLTHFPIPLVNGMGIPAVITNRY